MAVKEIITIPNEVLRKKAEKIKTIDDEIKKLAGDLIGTLNVAKDPEGAGIAATQIGVSKKMCVVRNFVPSPGYQDKFTHEDFILINPRIISTSKETDIEYEGCLSVPDIYGKVERFKKVKVDALNLAGEKITLKAQDFFARTLQHEIDHLDGILFTDRVIGKTINEEQLDKLYKNQEIQ